MIKVNGANGEAFNFPDGTDPSVIKQAMQKHYASSAPQAAPVPEEEQSVFADLLDSAKAVPKLAFDTARAVTDAATFGSMDEMASGLTAGATVAKDFIMGNEDGATFEEIFTAQQAYETEDRERFAEEHAALSTGAEITGMILSPINKALGAVKLLQASTALGRGAQVANVAKQGVTGAATAVPYVFLTADGTIAERADVALSPTVAISAAAFGIAGSKVISVGKNFFTGKFKKSLDVPTTANLEAAKNELYEQVSKAGITYPPSSVNKAVNQLIGNIQDKIAPTDTQAIAVFNQFKSLAARNAKKGTSLKELDTLQRDMWTRFNSTAGNKSEKGIILDAINKVDDLIANHPNNSEVMQLARAANSRFKKADQFDRLNTKMMRDESFKKAPVVDQMKQQVSKILETPKLAKYYDDVELKAFEDFLANKGTLVEQTLKGLRKLTPSMQMSALLAVGTSGAHLGLQAAGQVVGRAAGGFGKVKQQGRNAALTDMVKSGRQAPVSRDGMLLGNAGRAPAPLGAVPVSDAVEQNKRDMSMLREARAAR
tara:strand:- start:26 stop:1657 length:1632 start_codon:yes stop_codon:yes gene_type:complete